MIWIDRFVGSDLKCALGSKNKRLSVICWFSRHNLHNLLSQTKFSQSECRIYITCQPNNFGASSISSASSRNINSLAMPPTKNKQLYYDWNVATLRGCAPAGMPMAGTSSAGTPMAGMPMARTPMAKDGRKLRWLRGVYKDPNSRREIQVFTAKRHYFTHTNLTYYNWSDRIICYHVRHRFFYYSTIPISIHSML